MGIQASKKQLRRIRRRHDWSEIKRRYVCGNESLPELADKLGLNLAMLKKHSASGGWVVGREIAQAAALDEAKKQLARETAQWTIAEARAAMQETAETMRAMHENLRTPSFREEIGPAEYCRMSKNLRELLQSMGATQTEEAISGEMTIVRDQRSESLNQETPTASSTNGNGQEAKPLPYTPANGSS